MGAPGTGVARHTFVAPIARPTSMHQRYANEIASAPQKLTTRDDLRRRSAIGGGRPSDTSSDWGEVLPGGSAVLYAFEAER